VGARNEPEELVEAASVGMQLGGTAKMPLADESRLVAGGLETVGDGGLAERQTPIRRTAGIELMPKSRLIATGEKPGARRRAVRP
jgi:hypothetical protein